MGCQLNRVKIPRHFAPPLNRGVRRTREVSIEWKRSNPVYPVADVAASIDWYRRMFGFEPRVVNPPGDEVPVYAVLYRDTVSIHLLRNAAGAIGLAGHILREVGKTFLVVYAAAPLLYRALKEPPGESPLAFFLGIALSIWTG